MRFGVPEVTPNYAGLSVYERIAESVAEPSRNVRIPSVPARKSRECSRIGNIFRRRQTATDIGRRKLAFDAKNNVVLELVIAANLTTAKSATCVVIIGSEFRQKVAIENRAAEIIPITAQPYPAWPPT